MLKPGWKTLMALALIAVARRLIESEIDARPRPPQPPVKPSMWN